MTTYQAVVLISFNASQIKSFSQLVSELNVTEDVMKRVLHSLVCGKFKLLRKADNSGSSEKQDKVIRTTDSFVSNEHFRSRLKLI